MAFSPIFQRPFSATFDRRAAAAGNGLLNSLIAYWPGNEASGDLLDVHVNGLHLVEFRPVNKTMAGVVYATARNYDWTFHYRPSDDALLSAGDGDFTVAAWFKCTAWYGRTRVAGKWRGTPGCEYLLHEESTNYYTFIVSNDGGTSTTSTPNIYASANAWHFAIAWHDSVNDTINLQIDNGSVRTTDHTTGVADTSAPFEVAAEWFPGGIGPVAFWKSAAGGGGVLTAAQRTALYNGGAGLAYANFTT